MMWDDDMQMSRVGPDIEVQVYDGSNDLLRGHKWQKKQLEELPGLDYDVTYENYRRFFTALRKFAGAVYHPLLTRGDSDRVFALIPRGKH